jgi:hypothetical protein
MGQTRFAFMEIKGVYEYAGGKERYSPASSRCIAQDHRDGWEVPERINWEIT